MVSTLKANAPGVIATITSSSIFGIVPFYGEYRASKAAASSIAETMRVELARFGIRSIEILPGPVDTDMFAGTHAPLAAEEFDDYRGMAVRSHQLKVEHADPMLEPVDRAAVAIADAITDDDGPMRTSCDPMGSGMLDLWRRSDDETMYQLTGEGIAEA